MTTIDKSGESIEEIIRNFRKDYKIHDWELNYEILKKPTKGIFGLFAQKLAQISQIYRYIYVLFDTLLQ